MNIILYELFSLGRCAALLVSCIIILGASRLDSSSGIELYPIGKVVSFASHSMIPNKLITINLRLLFIQRNTQASNNNRNTL